MQRHLDLLHPRSTADCTHYIDGSSYSIDGRSLGENDVNPGMHQQGRAAPFIELVYFVLDGDTLRLDSRQFTAATRSGKTIAVAKAALWLNLSYKDWSPSLATCRLSFGVTAAFAAETIIPIRK